MEAEIITLTWQWGCDVCSTSHLELQNIPTEDMPILFWQMEYPPLPQGWRLLEGVLYCPHHHINVFVDNSLVESSVMGPFRLKEIK